MVERTTEQVHEQMSILRTFSEILCICTGSQSMKGKCVPASPPLLLAVTLRVNLEM